MAAQAARIRGVDSAFEEAGVFVSLDFSSFGCVQ
jgi:hypothetical protein